MTFQDSAVFLYEDIVLHWNYCVIKAFQDKYIGITLCAMLQRPCYHYLPSSVNVSYYCLHTCSIRSEYIFYEELPYMNVPRRFIIICHSSQIFMWKWSNIRNTGACISALPTDIIPFVVNGKLGVTWISLIIGNYYSIYILMSHCIATVAYIDLHYQTYLSKANNLQHLFPFLLPYMYQIHYANQRSHI